jgi:hypothetical protein
VTTVPDVFMHQRAGISLAHCIITKKDDAAEAHKQEGIEMDLFIVIVANSLSATIIYFVVTWIWDD